MSHFPLAEPEKSDIYGRTHLSSPQYFISCVTELFSQSFNHPDTCTRNLFRVFFADPVPCVCIVSCSSDVDERETTIAVCMLISNTMMAAYRETDFFFKLLCACFCIATCQSRGKTYKYGHSPSLIFFLNLCSAMFSPRLPVSVEQSLSLNNCRFFFSFFLLLFSSFFLKIYFVC